jgi:transposase
MIDRGGPGRKVGEQLLEHIDGLFAWRRWLREGEWSRSTWQAQIGGLRRSFHQELKWGARVRCRKTAATCRDLLAKEAALWTFVRVPEVAETNNVAEVRLVGQKSSTQHVWRIGPGAMRIAFSRPQNLIPVSV